MAHTFGFARRHLLRFRNLWVTQSMGDLEKIQVLQTNVPVSSKSRFTNRKISSPWPQLVQQMPPARYYSTSIPLYESCEMEAGAPQGNEIRASEDPWAILTAFPLRIRHVQAKPALTESKMEHTISRSTIVPGTPPTHQRVPHQSK